MCVTCLFCNVLDKTGHSSVSLCLYPTLFFCIMLFFSKRCSFGGKVASFEAISHMKTRLL